MLKRRVGGAGVLVVHISIVDRKIRHYYNGVNEVI